MNIEEFVNSYLQEHRHDVLLNPYNGLIDFANTLKEQIFKDAVEGFIFQSADYYPKQLIAGYDGELGMGDKAKIIIVPEKED